MEQIIGQRELCCVLNLIFENKLSMLKAAIQANGAHFMSIKRKEIYASADGGPRSRVCTGETLHSDPIAVDF